MNFTKRAKRAALVVMLAGLIVPLGVRGQATSSQQNIVRAITKPSKERKLQFQVPGLVREVKVKEGDTVKKGDLLIALDDRVEVNLFNQADIEAKSTVRVDLYKNEMGVKKLQLEREELLLKENAASKTDVEEKTLAVAQSKAQMDAATLDREGNKLKAEAQMLKIAEMKLVSPVDGVVTALFIGEGELAAPNGKDPSIVVVQNDPLWCEVQLPTAQAQRLKMADALEVRHANDKEDAWSKGKVIFVNPFANAGSDTQTVRIEVPNPNKRDSGMQVFVKLPDSVVNPAVANVSSR